MGAGIKIELAALFCICLLAIFSCQSGEDSAGEARIGAEALSAVELLWDPAAGEIEFVAAPADSASCRGPVDSDLSFSAHDAAIADDIVYVAYDQGLLLMDIADPTEPVVMGMYRLPTVQALAVADGRAYVACGIDGLLVIDVRDPRSPELVEHLDTPGLARGLVLVGEYLYLADGPAGLRVFAIGDRARPRELGSCDLPATGDAWEVEVRGKFAYVADGPAGLQVLDISDPAAPALVGGIDTPGYAGCIEMAAGHAFIADGFDGMQIIDVAVPARPVLAASYALPNFACAIHVARGLAYVADFGSGLQVLDIGRPTQPEMRYRCDMSCDAVDVIVRGDRAYLLSVDKLHVVDITDPGNLLETGSCAAVAAGG